MRPQFRKDCLFSDLSFGLSVISDTESEGLEGRDISGGF